MVNDKGEVTSVEIPILGKIKSNYPSVGICMIGAGLAVYTISRLDPPRDTVELATSFSLLEEAQANGLPPIIAAVPQHLWGTANTQADALAGLSFNVDQGQYTVFALKIVSITDGVTRWAIAQTTAFPEENRLAARAKLR